MNEEDATPVKEIEGSIGEYDPGGSKAQAKNRASFLEAIRNYELETLSSESSKYGRPCRVLTELSGVPFQRFQSLYDCTHHGFSSDLLRWNLFGGKWTKDNTAKWSEVFNVYGQGSKYDSPILNNISPAQYFAWVRLREAIVDWATTWNLATWEGNDPWFFDHTLETLHWWVIEGDLPSRMRTVEERSKPHARDKLQWYPLSAAWELPLDAPAPPQWLPAWEPDTEKQAEYLERVKRDARHRIDDSILSCSEASHRKAFVDSIEKKAAEYCKKVQLCESGVEMTDKRAELVECSYHGDSIDSAIRACLSHLRYPFGNLFSTLESQLQACVHRPGSSDHLLVRSSAREE